MSVNSFSHTRFCSDKKTVLKAVPLHRNSNELSVKSLKAYFSRARIMGFFSSGKPFGDVWDLMMNHVKKRRDDWNKKNANKGVYVFTIYHY